MSDQKRPIRLVIQCPKCGVPHIDRDEWRTRLHKKHLCEGCTHVWQPALEYTVGVQTLELLTKEGVRCGHPAVNSVHRLCNICNFWFDD